MIQVKTRLDDLGAVERQLGWYERSAHAVARRLGWRSRRIVTWLLLLASAEVEGTIRQNRDALALACPARAREMLAWLEQDGDTNLSRGLALIDPTSKRREWRIRSRTDGRRSPDRYVDYADAARRLSAPRSSVAKPSLAAASQTRIVAISP